MKTIAEKVAARIKEQYGSFYKAAKTTGLSSSCYHRLTNELSWSTIFYIADVHGIELEVSIK